MLPARHSGRARATTGSVDAPDAFGNQRSNLFWLLATATITAVLFAAALMLFEPFWESNDDIGMSMIAHGYGTARAPSSSLLFQNVIIGEILQLLPTFKGVLPYSWLAIVTMLGSGWALLYFMVRLGGHYVFGTIALAVVFAGIVPAPQFTITAGMATAAGVLAWLCHTRAPSLGSLLAGALLLIIGYLVRPEAAVFVLIVALPFVPWTKLPLGRAEIATATAVLAFVLFATLIDYLHYQGREWAAFREFEPLRVPLTDFNLADYILKHPNIMSAHGFSTNDIRLIANWFFFDPDVADPARLRALLSDLPAKNRLIENLPFVRVSLEALFDPTITPLMIAAVSMTALCRRPITTAVSWAIFIFFIVAFGLIGRPAVLHTYFPIPIMLLFVSLGYGLRPEVAKPMWRVLPVTVLLIALALSLQHNIAENKRLIEFSRLVQEDVSKLDRNQQYVIWGAVFPFEFALPVLEQDTDSGSFPSYGLGWESLAPFSTDTFKGTPWRNLVDRIARDRDIPFIAGKNQIRLLAEYCREHHHKTLKVRERPLKTFPVFYVTCGGT